MLTSFGSHINQSWKAWEWGSLIPSVIGRENYFSPRYKANNAATLSSQNHTFAHAVFHGNILMNYLCTFVPPIRYYGFV